MGLCWTENAPDWIDVVKTLVNAGAGGDDLFRKIQHITRDIAGSGSIDVLEALERHGCRLFQDPAQYSEALTAASEKGRAEMVRFICRKRSPTTSDVKAAISGSFKVYESATEIIGTLLSFNVPLFFDDDGPLIVASRKGSPEIVSLLLRNAKHSKVVIKRSLEASVIESHRNSRDYVACTRILLDFQPEERINHLAFCIRLFPHCPPIRSEEMITCLLDRGVHPDTQDAQNGTTLLYVAATKGETDAVKALISRGANVCLEGGEHGTPLHAAAAVGSWQVAELLLSAGADVNAQNEHLRSPLAAVMEQKWRLMCRAQHGLGECSSFLGCHRCCAQVLLEWGADVDALGEELKKELEAARKVGNMKGH